MYLLGQFLKDLKESGTWYSYVDRMSTFKEYNERTCRLANGLLKLGLKKGDRLCILSHNCLEFMELYAAAAKTGIVAVPMNWRISPEEMEYVIRDSEARALVLGEDFLETITKIRPRLGNLPEDAYVLISGGKPPAGYRSYEDVLASGPAEEPGARAGPGDVWIQLYTSGTTGKPKGVIHSHGDIVQQHYTSRMVLDLKEDTVYWCTADPGWVTGIVYSILGPWSNCISEVVDRASFDPERWY
jgi:acyl-coenzyme A synthetase/AMP-(fatty) acid ligase